MNQFVMTAEEENIVSKCMTIAEFERCPRKIRSTLLTDWKEEVNNKSIMTMRDIPKNLHNDGDEIKIAKRDF